MRKKIPTFFIFIIFSLLLAPSSISWSNGSYTYINYDYHNNYGTHDWIAQKALEILFDNDNSKWTWLKDREEIFLWATEAPDNAGLDMNLDNETISGFGDFENHHVFFFINGTVKYFQDKAAVRAQWCFGQAESCLIDKKYEQAAFYFGAMTHYISDCSMYAHIAENYVQPYNLNFDKWHSLLESLVQNRTDNAYNRKEFFNYSIQNIEKKNAYDATLDVGWDTFSDPIPSESIVRNAYWLHNNFFPDWAFDYDERITETNQTRILYYSRIEENINKAIEGCITAMNMSEGPFQGNQRPLDINIILIIITIVIVVVGSILIILFITQGKKLKRHGIEDYTRNQD